MTTFLWISAIVLALVGAHNVALWAERRGWLYYKYRRASPGSVGNALLRAQSFVNPSAAHELEARSGAHEVAEVPGEPPTPVGGTSNSPSPSDTGASPP